MVPELRPRSVGEVLDAAVRLYRARLGSLMLVSAVVLVPVSLLSMLVLLSALPDESTVGISTNAPVFDTGASAAELGAILVTTVLSALATTFVTAATTRIVADAYVGERAATGEAVRDTTSRVWPLIGLTLVVTVATTAGFFACVVPGVWLQVAWSVAIPAFMLERVGVFDALRRSFALTKVKFWLVVRRVLAESTARARAHRRPHGAVGVVDAIERQRRAPTSSCSPSPTARRRSSRCRSRPSAIVALYFDLRTRAEAFDVQMMIAGLDREPCTGFRPRVILLAGRRPGRRARGGARHPRTIAGSARILHPDPSAVRCEWLGDRISTIGGWISDVASAVPWFVWLAIALARSRCWRAGS